MSPFQRDSPADRADYADNVIWRRLKVLEEFWFLVLPENALIFTWPFICPSVCVLFCICVIYVFSAAFVEPRLLALSDECEVTILWLSVAESVAFPGSLGQISKKDAGVYEVVLKDDRGKDTSTLNLKDQGSSAQRRLGSVPSGEGEWLFMSSSRFQRLDEWSFQFYR